MNRVLLVAQYEFFSNIKKRSFLLAAIGGPLFTIGIMIFATLLSLTSLEAGQVKGEKVGYVDQTGFLAETTLPETYRAYADEESGRQALESDNREIDVLAVIPANYIRTGALTLYADGNVPDSLKDELEGVLSTALAGQLTDDVPEERVKNPTNTEFYLENNQRALNSEAAVVAVIATPIVFLIIFMIALQLTGTYLMTSIVEEKTNRIMEILATSVTPTQLLAGKLLGAGGLGLVQILIWIIVAAIGLIIGQGTDFVQAIQVPLDIVLIALAYFVLSYFMFGSVLAGVGVVVGSEQESRQIAGVVSVVTVIPLMLMSAFLFDPDGAVPVFLSLFPLTAPMAMLLRLLLSTVSPVELAISFALMVVTTVVFIWISARVFRWAMLLYGKSLTPRELWRIIRGRPDSVIPETAQQGR